jgi:ankyrin repeat protein
LTFTEDQKQSIKCAKILLDLRNFGNDETKRSEYLDTPTAKSRLERTALMLAARSANTDLMELLIRSGANALKEDYFGSTVLYYAVDNGMKYTFALSFLPKSERVTCYPCCN